MSQEISITINADDDAMVGAEGWGEYNARASIDTFVARVASAVAAAYPDATVSVSASVSILNTRVDGVDDDEYIREIISNVWQSWSWLEV